MRCSRVAVIVSITILVAGVAWAADHCVIPGATGSGASWSDAMSLPATMVRGDTYWLCDGEYGQYEFVTPASGTTMIYIVKATADEHGPSTGWNSSFGDGTAEFVRIRCLDPYLSIRGQTVGSTANYGIHIHQTANTAALDIRNDAVNDASNITIEEVDIEHAGMNMADYNNGDAIFLWGGDNDWLENLMFRNCYVHDATRTLILARNTRHVLFDTCVFANCQNNVGIHGEGVSWDTTYGTPTTNTVLDVEWASCVWKDIEGAGVIVIGLQHGTSAKWHSDIRIHGNVFYSTSDLYTVTDGVIAALADNDLSDFQLHNNTFAFMRPIGNFAFIFTPDASANDKGNVAYNNIIYAWTKGARWPDTGITHDYNWYYSSGNTFAEAHQQNGTILKGFDGYEFALPAATDPGITLEAPYNLDPSEVKRGADGLWDRGAYEFTGASLNAPTGLRIKP